MYQKFIRNIIIHHKTDNKKDIIKMKDLFNEFKESDYYSNLTKNDKRKYNYTLIIIFQLIYF